MTMGSERPLTSFFDDVPVSALVTVAHVETLVEWIRCRRGELLRALEAEYGIGGIFEILGWTMYPAEQEADGEWGWPYAIPDNQPTPEQGAI